jgi:hypothetical protein
VALEVQLIESPSPPSVSLLQQPSSHPRLSQMDAATDSPLLPTRGRDGEYRPFSRRVGEFTFWLKATQAVLLSFLLTCFSAFNIPVFWPFLVIYFVMLFGFSMKNQIMHMYKHKYVPCSWGKKRYGGGRAANGAAPVGGGPLFAGSSITSRRF